MHREQPDSAGLRAELAEACRMLAALGATHGALGHVSLRPEGSNSILIRGRGPDEVGLRFTRPDDIVEVDSESLETVGRAGIQAPLEVHLHLGIYRRTPSVRSVVHVHPRYAVLLTIAEKTIRPIYGSFFGQGARLAIEGVPTYPSSAVIDRRDLGDDFAEFLGNGRAALMNGHGATVTGASVREATTRGVALADLAQMTYEAHLLGEPRLVPQDEIEAMRSKFGVLDGQVESTWRMYQSMVESTPTVHPGMSSNATKLPEGSG